MDVKSWAMRLPSCEAVRPAQCPACEAASREPGRRTTIVGHGSRARWIEGPLEPEQDPIDLEILGRRYRCRACGAVLVVVPHGVGRALRYSLGAIAGALALWGYARATAAQARKATSTARARGPSSPEQWSSLRRWTSRASTIFGAGTPSLEGTLRERAARIATWLASHAPLGTGSVPQDAFYGGRFVHAR